MKTSCVCVSKTLCQARRVSLGDDAVDFNAEEPSSRCRGANGRRTLNCQSVPEEWKSVLYCILPFYPLPAQPKSTCVLHSRSLFLDRVRFTTAECSCCTTAACPVQAPVRFVINPAETGTDAGGIWGNSRWQTTLLYHPPSPLLTFNPFFSLTMRHQRSSPVHRSPTREAGC